MERAERGKTSERFLLSSMERISPMQDGTQTTGAILYAEAVGMTPVSSDAALTFFSLEQSDYAFLS